MSRLVKYKGYAGNGNAEHLENIAMGLSVGKIYKVVGHWDCGEGCRSPSILNDYGIKTDLCHDEVEEV